MWGKHTTNNSQYIRGLFRIKSGCILLTGFVDHEFYSRKSFKQLNDYIMRLPTVSDSYFGIEKRIKTEHSPHFEENIELSRECFGLSYSELKSLVKWYAQTLGTFNSYSQYPRLTRSTKKDNFCDITGMWIPAGFPYITFNDSGYDLSHVSLHGFYRHISTIFSMGTEAFVSEIFEDKSIHEDILNQVLQIDDDFPFEILVTREYIFPGMYVN